jgi:hypothetical protein
MKTLAVLWSTLALIAALLGHPSRALQAQRSERAVIDVQKLGPQVGDRVPDFNLKDQTGHEWTLKSIMGPKGAMIVFIRSADW